MLKEICITPEVFNTNHINNVNWKDIKSLLENIKISGYIVGLNNNEWKKEIRENIAKLEPKIQDRFNVLITCLNNRNRIVGHPKGTITPSNEDDWLEIAKELNDIQSFYYIITEKPFSSNSKNIEDLEDLDLPEIFGLTGSKHFIKNEQELAKIFQPLLSYAKKVTIIDPYFDISVKRYKETLQYICKSFKNRRGLKEKGSITINCSTKIVNTSNFKNWQREINEIFKQFGHLITINVWEKKEESLKLHDRYIITDQSGIVSAAGTDKDEYQQSEWSIKDYSSLNSILEQYKENSSPFDLKYIVTMQEVKKNV